MSFPWRARNRLELLITARSTYNKARYAAPTRHDTHLLLCATGVEMMIGFGDDLVDLPAAAH
jgi:hypothetical protein